MSRAASRALVLSAPAPRHWLEALRLDVIDVQGAVRKGGVHFGQIGLAGDVAAADHGGGQVGIVVDVVDAAVVRVGFDEHEGGSFGDCLVDHPLEAGVVQSGKGDLFAAP